VEESTIGDGGQVSVTVVLSATYASQKVEASMGNWCFLQHYQRQQRWSRMVEVLCCPYYEDAVSTALLVAMHCLSLNGGGAYGGSAGNSTIAATAPVDGEAILHNRL